MKIREVGTELWYICGVNDCNECKREKRHCRTNIGKMGKTSIMMATVPHATSGSELRQFQVA